MFVPTPYGRDRLTRPFNEGELIVGLFQNNVQPWEQMDMSDLVESCFGGYLPVKLPATDEEIHWKVVDPGQMVYGYFLAHAGIMPDDPSLLLGAERFTTPYQLIPDDELHLIVSELVRVEQ